MGSPHPPLRWSPFPAGEGLGIVPPLDLFAVTRPIRLRRADTEGVILDRREGSRAPSLRVTGNWVLRFAIERRTTNGRPYDANPITTVGTGV